eukprot:GILK01016834.1.p1 GENE.GILK01016834.1~~GILK01016834.1.p1  ORF type:complete len:135 (+),score=23.71 GILK01016834.1:201-605(+)
MNLSTTFLSARNPLLAAQLLGFRAARHTAGSQSRSSSSSSTTFKAGHNGVQMTDADEGHTLEETLDANARNLSASRSPRRAQDEYSHQVNPSVHHTDFAHILEEEGIAHSAENPYAKLDKREEAIDQNIERSDN